MEKKNIGNYKIWKLLNDKFYNNHFHSYYNATKFLVPEESTRYARLQLTAAVRQILHNGLALLGLSAPEKM
mgnify:CR=1 FL=1